MSKSVEPKKINQLAFIGAGNMARSLIGGLLQEGYPSASISASDPSTECLDLLAAEGVTTYQSNADNIAQADIVILAVKPQLMAQVLTPLKAMLSNRKPVLISIAAGITCGSLMKWAGADVPIVRCMPNTPALVREGATALFANDKVSAEQKEATLAILSAVGLALWVERESDLDTVTALSGSGPAYFFLVMETMQAIGESLGLSADIAAKLTHQTALGAARMAITSDVDTAELRKRVTSPNGTTQAALESFARDKLQSIFDNALKAAAQRSIELAQELDND